MHIDTNGATARLGNLLAEALKLADSLGLSLAAIHIDEAKSHVATTAPADMIEILPHQPPIPAL